MTVSILSDCNHRSLSNNSTGVSSEKYHHHQTDHCTNGMQKQLDHFSQQSKYQRRPAPKYNYTWLVFKEERWQPFDPRNQFILEETLSVDGTFVDISDSLFPGVKRVRVFPRNNYLSYLGLKYRMSRVLQPDAWSWFS